MSILQSPGCARHRATGVVASALASAKQDGINYPEHVADRALEALGTQGFVIVEKAVQP